MLSADYILGFMGFAVMLFIGIAMFNDIEQAFGCVETTTTTTVGNVTTTTITNQEYINACERAHTIAWTVVSIMPIGMFFAIFGLFRAFQS